MHKFDKNPCMDFKGELCSERNATQRKLLLCLSLSNSYIKIFEKSKPPYEIFS